MGNPLNNGETIGTYSHTIVFSSPGTYQVTISPGSGTFTRFFFDGPNDPRKLLEVRQWGNIQWETMERMFVGCQNLQITATDAPDLSNVSSMEAMFGSCGALSAVPGINNWDVSSVTNMKYLFSGADLFNSPLDNWDVSNVTAMNGMFYETEFNQPIGNWKVGNVTDMSGMFGFAIYFNQPIGSWDVSKVVSMYAMFQLARSFNQPLNDWDVSQVTEMSEMFNGAYMFNQPLDKWEVGNVARMRSMFESTFAFNQPIGSWNVGNVSDMHSMFRQAGGFNQPLDTWDVGNVEDMQSMFHNAVAFNQPLNSWDVSKVTNMTYLFAFTDAFNQPLNNWDLSQTTTIAVMFWGAKAFNQPVGEWNVSGIASMYRAFYNATAFNQSLGNWTLSPGSDMTNLVMGSGMDCANMSRTLKGWADNPATPDNMALGAQGITYATAAAAALQTLTTTKNWSIQIGGEVLCEALPVSLISFDAQSTSGTVKLDWATASETDNDYFDIERSPDARSWKAIGRIKGAGTVNSIQRYATTDANPLEGRSYYRLKIVDFEGKAEYSNIRVIITHTLPVPSIYPNPATTSITLSGKPDGYVKIYRLSGQEVGKIVLEGEKTIIPISELPAGPYLLKSDDGWSSKFIKY